MKVLGFLSVVYSENMLAWRLTEALSFSYAKMFLNRFFCFYPLLLGRSFRSKKNVKTRATRFKVSYSYSYVQIVFCFGNGGLFLLFFFKHVYLSEIFSPSISENFIVLLKTG